MSNSLIPWEPQNIPEEICAELNRRKTVRGLNFISGDKGEWNDEKGDWSKYLGPMIPFVRFCSNGAGKSAYLQEDGTEYFDKKGFVLYGGKDFYSGYGFSNAQLGSTNSIIGYMPDGAPHTIENDTTSNYPIHVPPPEIEKITVTIQKNLYRRANVEWICFSPKQLEYLTPYFLVPRITCVLEWGWNHFDPSSLLDLTDETLLKELKKHPYPLYTKHILKSRGNYDVLFGIISHWEWAIEGTRIRCRTEITSLDRIYAGLLVDTSIMTRSPNEAQEPPIKLLDTLKVFIRDVLPNIRSIATTDNPKKLEGGIGEFAMYLSKEYPENIYGDRWKEILYGIFYGRDLENKTTLTSKGDFPTTLPTFGPTGPNIRTNKKEEESDTLNYDNKNSDFDRKDQKSVWINMGMFIEILNYHSHELKGFDDEPMFKIDIDDCVISGHPNLISSDGSVLLIPNKEAPKYFYGILGQPAGSDAVLTKEFTTDSLKAVIANPANPLYSFLPNSWKSLNTYSPDNWKWVDKEVTTPAGQGIFAPSGTQKVRTLIYSPPPIQSNLSSAIKTPTDYDKMGNCDSKENFSKRQLTKEEMEELGILPDYWLQKVCWQPNFTAYRDDLDSVINALRYSKVGTDKSYAFPFFHVQDSGIKNTVGYPRRYAGHLKDLYFNVKALQDILNDSSVKTFQDVIGKVLTSISNAATNIWDFRLVNSTGKAETERETKTNIREVVTMKIIDYRFIYSINRGTVYTFDYFDADSLLQSIKFNPIISDPQAMRTIFAATNNPQNRTVISDSNELLDYHFKDRLFLNETTKKDHSSGQRSTSAFNEMLKKVQLLVPPEGVHQMTMKKNDGNVIVKRLDMPIWASELLKMLVNDEDVENNPRYLGIMPNIQTQFTIQGIGGLRTFMMFLVRNLPEPYSYKNIVFQIVDLTETIENGKWTTTITAGILPLRDRIKRLLGIF